MLPPSIDRIARRLLQRARRDPETVLFGLIWVALSIVALVPVWQQRMLPMLDIPDHLALARAWHSYHDRSWHLADYYTLRIRIVPYFFYYLTIHLLLYLCNIELANKLFLSAYLILYPLSIYALARRLHRSRWLVLGAFALAFNPCWIYGFASYLLGTCFLYFGWAQLIDYLENGQRRHLVGTGVLCMLAYLSHVMVWGVFGLGALGLMWIHRRDLKRLALAAVAMAPTVLLAVWAFIEEKREQAYMNHGKGFHGTWKDAPDSLKEFPRRVMELFPGDLDMWTLAIVAATVLVYALWRSRAADAGTREKTRDVKVLLWILGATYLLLPYTINRPLSWWYVAPRVPALMAPLILLLPAGPIRDWRALLSLPMVVMCFALPIHLAQLYRDFSRRNLGFMHIIDHLPRGKKVLVLARGLVVGGPEDSGDRASSAPVYWHFLSWPMALKGGFSPYLFNQGIPVQPRATVPTFSLSQTDIFDFRRYPDYDYYIAHESSDSLNPDKSVHREDVSGGGTWVLYKRVAPMTDEP